MTDFQMVDKDTVDQRTVTQRRQFVVHTITHPGGGSHKVVAGNFVDARIKYHAALVAKDAGLIHHVWVTEQWMQVFGDGIKDCTDWMGDDQR